MQDKGLEGGCSGDEGLTGGESRPNFLKIQRDECDLFKDEKHSKPI